jgi:hypothetical protein
LTGEGRSQASNSGNSSDGELHFAEEVMVFGVLMWFLLTRGGCC